jgi:hypothetical protein
MPAPNQKDVRTAIDVLRRLIALAEAGEIDASRATRDQLRGAIAALDALAVTATDHLR